MLTLRDLFRLRFPRAGGLRLLSVVRLESLWCCLRLGGLRGGVCDLGGLPLDWARSRARLNEELRALSLLISRSSFVCKRRNLDFDSTASFARSAALCKSASRTMLRRKRVLGFGIELPVVL